MRPVQICNVHRPGGSEWISAIQNRASRYRRGLAGRCASVCHRRDRTRRLLLSRTTTDGVVNLGWSRGDTASASARQHATAAAADQRLKAPQRPARSDTERPHHHEARFGACAHARHQPSLSSGLRLTLVSVLRPLRGNAATRRVRSLLRIVAPWSSALDDAPSIRVAGAWVSIA